MRLSAKVLGGPVLALWLLPVTAETQMQSVPAVPLGGTATRLSSIVYFDPPNEQRVKLRLSGSEMTPLPGNVFNVKQLAVQQFNLAGSREALVEAPECLYAPLDGEANSAGHLRLTLGDNKIRIEGDGFFWRQSDNSLAISNNVYTVMKTGAWKVSAP
jgi:hypothetical protein